MYDIPKFKYNDNETDKWLYEKLQKYSEERNKKMKLVEKIASIFLSLVVLLGLISQTVFADGEGTR